MSKRIFISYHRADGGWVWGRLKPCLEAGGASVLIDEDRFGEEGVEPAAVDDLQDAAELHLLVLSAPYLASDLCWHEMERAVAADPEFSAGKVLLVRRDETTWPGLLNRHHPSRVSLFAEPAGYGDAEQWAHLLQACDAALGTCPTRWLAAGAS